MHRFFSNFPRGHAGVGLLLLRAAVGITAILHGATGLSDNLHHNVAGWGAASLAVAGGASLVAGFLTPFAGAMILIGAVGTVLASDIESPDIQVLVAVLAVAVILLGPGATSLDARLFGRREIIIPRAPHSPKS